MHYYRVSVAVGFLLLLLHTFAKDSQDDPKTTVTDDEKEDEKIVDKTKTVERKYLVSIRYNEYDRLYGYGVGHYCSGSLIYPDIVLTAAHCFDNYDAKDLKVVMGSVDLLKKKNHFVSAIRSVTLHPDYEKEKLPNDIAVVYLNSSVPSDNRNIETIEINREFLEKGTICHVTGWPYRGSKTEALTEPKLLESVEVPVIPACKNTGYETYKIVAPGMLCAGDNENGGTGPCGGDTGGPLVCNGVLAGIASFGSRGECQLPNFPGVYTQVDYYQDWIGRQKSHSLAARQTGEQNPEGSAEGGSKSGSENLSPIVASIFVGTVAAFIRV